ncbi:MAG: hypothetical protein GXP16_03500 [Gammaproteobacteria bacterium]|nr:hypothetical protein [Gammaproteobacteria bacterium]
MQALKHTTFEQPEATKLAFENDGGVIIDNFISAEVAAKIHTAFSAALEDEPWCNIEDTDRVLSNQFFGLTTKRLHGVAQYDPEIINCLTHKCFVQFARHYLGEKIIMSTGELMAIGASEVRQALHRDGDSWHRAGISANILVSANIALTPFHQSNGATVVVPGSHLWDRDRQPESHELAFAEMNPGSALLYNGQILHGGGANSTDTTRIGLYFGYIPAWLRPLENTTKTLPEDFLNNLPSPTQKLLGYCPSGFDVVL